MKVLHCITGLTPDGAQQMLLRLIKNWPGKGISHVLVSLTHREPMAEEFEKIGCPVHCLNMPAGIPDPLALMRLRRMLREESPSLLHGWMYHANFALTLARTALAGEVPLVWNIRRGLDDLAERKLLTRLLVHSGRIFSRQTTRIIYCTERSAEQHEALGFDASKRVVLGNGFDSTRFQPDPTARAALLAKLGLEEDVSLVGNIGRYDVAKGHGFLVDSFARIAERFAKAHLVLIGRGLDIQNEAVREAIASRNLGGRIHLLGERKDVEKLYPAFDVYCSSSIAEGFPNVVAEAMSCGVPCVATDTGASRDLVEGSGIVVPARSEAALADGLVTLLSLPRVERGELGRRARDRIVHKFSIASIAEEYERLYGAIFERQGAALQQAA